MLTVIIILQLIAALFLILVVLFQSGKSQGLSGAIGGIADSYMAKSKAKSIDAKLAKATNANGINYATVVVDKRGILPPAVAQTAKAMRQEIKAKYKEIAITMDDYSTSASSNTMAADESALDVQVSDTEFTDVTDKDKDLPFV